MFLMRSKYIRLCTLSCQINGGHNKQKGREVRISEKINKRESQNKRGQGGEKFLKILVVQRKTGKDEHERDTDQ